MDGDLSRPLDTTPEAWQAQVEILRRMSGSRRVELAWALTRAARDAARDGIRARHPEYDAAQLRRAFFRMMHGDETTRRVWPGEDLLAS